MYSLNPQLNVEKEKLRHAKWFRENKHKILAWCNQYYRDTPSKKLALVCRSRVRTCLGSGKEYPELIGCSNSFLKEWMEFQFNWDIDKGLSWDNQKEWHVDHVLPCFVFDLSITEERKTCFHWTNLSPLYEIDNLRKSKIIILTSVMKQNVKILEFCASKNIPPQMLYIKPYLHKTKVIFHMFDSSDTKQKCKTPQLRELPKDSTTNLISETERENPGNDRLQ